MRQGGSCVSRNYLTLAKSAEVYLEFKRSQFYSACKPVNSEEEAKAFLDERRALRPSANHHCYAWIIGSSRGDQRYQRYSDDGEPHGTAGPPIFNVLERGGIEDAVIVVTRIFGGTLLGTGGLVQAYGSSASEVVKVAGLSEYRMLERYQVLLSYPAYYSFQTYLTEAPVRVLSESFAVDVELELALDLNEVPALEAAIQAASRGEAIVERLDPEYFAVPLSSESESENNNG